MKTAKEIRAAIKRLLDEGKPLAERSKNNDLDDAGETRLTEIMTEVDGLKNDLIAAEAREARNASIMSEHETYSRPAGRQSAGAGAGASTLDRRDDDPGYRSVGQRFAESDEFRAFQSSNLRSGGRVEFESFRPSEQRALVHTGALPSGLIEPQRIPGIFAPDPIELTVRSAFLGGQTDSNTIEYFYESSFTNNADWVPEATHTLGASESPTPNASVKPESALAWLGATVPVKTIAHWIPITRQTLQDAPQLRSIVDTRLLQGLDEVIDNDLIHGDGVGANLKGLLAFSGIQDLDGSYFGTNPVEGTGGPNEDFNRILRARQMIRYTGRGRADFILINPADMERFLTRTDSNDQYLAGGPFSNGLGIQRLWGLRVIESEFIDEGEPIVGDGRMAQVFDRMQSTIEVGYVNDQFIRNMQTVLAETRLALAVYRPATFAVVALS